MKALGKSWMYTRALGMGLWHSWYRLPSFMNPTSSRVRRVATRWPLGPFVKSGLVGRRGWGCRDKRCAVRADRMGAGVAGGRGWAVRELEEPY